jgi:hypothetical protein
MKFKQIPLFAAIAIGASSVTIIAIRILELSKEDAARQEIRAAATNMVMKPPMEISLFPEK